MKLSEYAAKIETLSAMLTTGKEERFEAAVELAVISRDLRRALWSAGYAQEARELAAQADQLAGGDPLPRFSEVVSGGHFTRAVP